MQRSEAGTANAAPGSESGSLPRVTGQAGRQWLVLLLVGVALLGLVLLSLGVGAVHIAPGVLARGLLGDHAWTATERAIVLELRLPRTLAAGLIGAALSVAGLLFQGLFRNPMADPYVIGSSGGAVVGAAVGIFWFSQATLGGWSATEVLAFAGSLATMAVVYALAWRRSGTEVVTLLLAGLAVSTILGSTTYLFEALDTGENTRVLLAWLRGIVSTPGWGQLAVAGALVCLGVLGSVPLMRQLDTLALGEEYARQLGLRVEWTRAAVLVAGSLLTAVSVSLGGLIGFAGLIVPHVARMLLGPGNLRLLPVCALGGAALLVGADALARTVAAPAELPVGVLMALVGGPFFLYLLRRQTSGGAGL